MITCQIYNLTAHLKDEEIQSCLMNGLDGKFAGQRVLVLIPDHTRSVPLPRLFRLLADILQDVRQLDFMVSLGTHPLLSEEQLLRLVGLSVEEYRAQYGHIRLLNHNWDDPAALISLGVIQQDELRAIAGSNWHPSLPPEVAVQINKAALAYDHILILGPTFPHEVVGFSGGAKYLFPGISGAEMINATHWLGALATVVGTIGLKDTPVRTLIHAAAQRLSTPVTLVALIVEGHDLAGVVIGDLISAWNSSADLSAQRHIRWCEKPFKRVLSCAPPMYDELWTAAKAMYKIEPAVETGGEVIIYAPHLEVVSHTHGKYIYEVGYHILPYFLSAWDKFKQFPLGVLAHSTHLRGSGLLENGIEKPNVRVTLASKISPEDCSRLGLGYLDPDSIHPAEWENREDEGILVVPRAGEILYRTLGSKQVEA
jgi:nickel-dependent lactate racemase